MFGARCYERKLLFATTIDADDINFNAGPEPMTPAPSLAAFALETPDQDVSPPEAPSWAEPAAGYLEQDAMRFFYRWGGHLSATLIRVRSRFDGDLDQYLLYLVFLLAEISEQLPRGPRPPQTFRRRRGLNALSLADITQIPARPPAASCWPWSSAATWCARTTACSRWAGPMTSTSSSPT